MEQYYSYLYIGVLICLGIGILFALIRTIIGPRIADRIMGINIIGTLSLGAIAVLAVYLNEGWLTDVSLVYCILSFLAVVVLAQLYISAFRKKKGGKDGE